MPYLKNCSLVLRLDESPIAEIRKVSFLQKGNNGYIARNEVGQSLRCYLKGARTKTRLIAYTGTPISDRDYRLAVARAKALQTIN